MTVWTTTLTLSVARSVSKMLVLALRVWLCGLECALPVAMIVCAASMELLNENPTVGNDESVPFICSHLLHGLVYSLSRDFLANNWRDGVLVFLHISANKE